jgi:hypothetical protein
VGEYLQVLAPQTFSHSGTTSATTSTWKTNNKEPHLAPGGAAELLHLPPTGITPQVFVHRDNYPCKVILAKKYL